MHPIELTEPAFTAFRDRAAALGLSVSEYLNQMGTATHQPDGFVLTPELRAAIQEAVNEANRGELVTLEQSRASRQEFKAQWRAANNL